jgi:hypothetical protein
MLLCYSVNIEWRKRWSMVTDWKYNWHYETFWPYLWRTPRPNTFPFILFFVCHLRLRGPHSKGPSFYQLLGTTVAAGNQDLNRLKWDWEFALWVIILLHVLKVTVLRILNVTFNTRQVNDWCLQDFSLHWTKSAWWLRRNKLHLVLYIIIMLYLSNDNKKKLNCISTHFSYHTSLRDLLSPRAPRPSFSKVMDEPSSTVC